MCVLVDKWMHVLVWCARVKFAGQMFTRSFVCVLIYDPALHLFVFVCLRGWVVCLLMERKKFFVRNDF